MHHALAQAGSLVTMHIDRDNDDYYVEVHPGAEPAHVNLILERVGEWGLERFTEEDEEVEILSDGTMRIPLTPCDLPEPMRIDEQLMNTWVMRLHRMNALAPTGGLATFGVLQAFGELFG